MSEKHNKMCKALNYFKRYLVFFSARSCVSISAFASLISVPVDIVSSAVGLKTCAITEGIKKYKSIIKERGKKHDKIVLLGKAKLDIIKVILSKTLINSYISHDKFVLVNNLSGKYKENKE